jgi:hypothetical protein
MLSSERIDALSVHAELFYRRLQQVADDHGRYFANPKLIRSAAFPLRTDTVALDDIASWLDECEAAGLVTLYVVGPTRYLQIEDFGQRVQSRSKFPDPPGSTVDHGESRGKTAIGVVVVEGVVEGGDVPEPTRKRRTSKTAMPPDFAISERVRQWAEAKGHGNLDRHLDHFRSKALAKGYEYADWDEAFMGAVRDDWAKVATSPKSKQRVQL